MQKIIKGLFSTVPVQSVAGLHPFAQCIYMWLCKYSNDDNKCRPSINTLCKNTSISKNSIIKYLNILEKKGFIKKTNRCTEGEYNSNMYDVFVIGGSAGGELGGSAGVALPSAGGELGGSAGVALPSAGGGNELNTLTKYNYGTKYNNKINNTPDGDFITLDFVSSTAQGEAEQKIGVAKFTKQKIDYSSELNQLQEIWNEADKGLKIPKAKVITDKAKQRYAVLRKTFSWELIAEGFDNYFDFVAKKKPGDLYYDHRFSFSDFIVNQYGLEKYAS